MLKTRPLLNNRMEVFEKLTLEVLTHLYLTNELDRKSYYSGRDYVMLRTGWRDLGAALNVDTEHLMRNWVGGFPDRHPQAQQAIKKAKQYAGLL